MKNYFSDISQNYNNLNGGVNNPPAPNPDPTTPVPLTTDSAIVMGVIDITKESIRCYTEYIKCKEQEETERRRISATLRAIQYQIDAQKDVYLKELEKKFEERNRLYDMAEKAQAVALEIGDKEMLQICYNLILNVYMKACGSNGSMPSLLGGSFNSF